MNRDAPADAEREKSELIEHALLMNLIFSLDTGPEGSSADVAALGKSDRPSAERRPRQPGSEG
jgi:hypothetical protein